MAQIAVSFEVFGEFWVPAGTTAAQLGAGLSQSTHQLLPGPLYVGSTRLDPQHTAGVPPLAHGAHVTRTPADGPEILTGTQLATSAHVASLTTGHLFRLPGRHGPESQSGLSKIPEPEGIGLRVRSGRVRVRAARGWHIVGRSRPARWQPGQVLVTVETKTLREVRYQLRGPGAGQIPARVPLRARLKHVEPGVWVSAGLGAAMSTAIAITLGRPIFALMGLVFPLGILATQLFGRGPRADRGPAIDAAGSPPPVAPSAGFRGADPSGTGRVRVPLTGLEHLTGPHPCDLSAADLSAADLAPGSAPCVLLEGDAALTVPYARALIVGRAAAGIVGAESSNPMPAHALAEPWLRWLPGGRGAAASVLVLSAGQRAPSWGSAIGEVGHNSVRWRFNGATLPAGPVTVPRVGITMAQAQGLARSLPGTCQPGAIPQLAPLPALVGGNEADDRTPGHDVGTTLATEVGLGAGGVPVVVDLVADGPHALVAGTTGAGKSEFLQTLVLGLAARFSPQDLCLALVDYKGGAGFSHCAKLPHVVGMVTDLAPGSARRAIAGLRKTLSRREALFAEHGVSDFAQFRAQQRLPRIVIVVDELRALVDDHPTFIADLVRIAAQGRSLGIHLVLATQRPAGAITAEMRANLNARVCLRVATVQDSIEVLGSDCAFTVGPQATGRAYLQLGGGTPLPLQAYYAGALPQPPGVQRAAIDPETGALGTPATEGTPGAVLLDRVAALGARWRLAGKPAPLWSAALPTEVTLDLAQLPAAGRKPRPGEILLGLGESVGAASHHLVGVAPTCNLALLGAARSGHTTALLTLAASALGSGHDVHGIFGPGIVWEQQDWNVQTGGNQTPTYPRGRVGTIAAQHEVRRIETLLRALTARPHPRVQVLLIDDLGRLRETLESRPGGRGWHDLQHLLRSAAALSVMLVVTSHTPLPPSLASLFPNRLVYLTDQAQDDIFLGAPKVWAGTGRVPGRGVLLTRDDPVLVQVAQRVEATGARHVTGAVAAVPLPPRIADLPHTLMTADAGLLGVCGPSAPGTLSSVRVPTNGSWLVVGPPGSGRSMALARFEHGEAGIVKFGGTDLESVTALAADPDRAPCTVLLDDVDDLFAHGPQEAGRAVDGLLLRGYRIIASARTASLVAGVPLALKVLTNGIALQPAGRGEMSFLGQNIEQHTDPAHLHPGPLPPGRGVLVMQGQVQAIQIARRGSEPHGSGLQAQSWLANGRPVEPT